MKRLQRLLRPAFLLPVFVLAACSGNGCGEEEKTTVSSSQDVVVHCQDRNRGCNTNADCCGTLTCNAAKICTDGLSSDSSVGSCSSASMRCTSSSQCCGTLACIDGFCQ